ncbi:MAG: penicillin-binding protein activator [Coxiellaceae bacterium]|nr:penicillin-binding protein activator [Coxiellaceae bacterium]
MMKRLLLCFGLSIVLLLAGCATAPRSQSFQVTSPNHIALLVPLSGPLAPYGNAIRNGFFAAYYTAKDQNGTSPTIDVLDTNGQSIQSVYQTAIAQGANFVVGPLDKPSVTTLAQQHLSVPVLALNMGNSPANNAALIEFALSPTDEAEQAAIKANADHHHAVLILAPQTAYGTRLVSAFSAQWKKTGGTVVATQYYNDISTLSQSISNVLQISQGRKDARTLERMLQRNVRYIPQRRQDFDSIFMVATPTMAKQIELLLRFYFVENIPIYATSQVYNGMPNPELDGVMFCDMPWTLAPNQMQPAYLQSIQQRIQATWPNNYTGLAKFYAMGVDAFNVIPQLSAMQSSPSDSFSGATGTLYLSSDRQIKRQLLWAQIKNGMPVVM